MHTPLSNALLKLINWVVEPIYNNLDITPSRYFKRARRKNNSIKYDENSPVIQLSQIKEINDKSMKKID